MYYNVGPYYTCPKLTPAPWTPALIDIIFQMCTIKLSHKNISCQTVYAIARKIMPFRAGIIRVSKVLLMGKMCNTLQLPVFFFFSFFCQPYPNYQGIQSKKIFSRLSNSYYNSVICSYEKGFFGVYSFSNQVAVSPRAKCLFLGWPWHRVYMGFF